jgi:hypothetical protein
MPRSVNVSVTEDRLQTLVKKMMMDVELMESMNGVLVDAVKVCVRYENGSEDQKQIEFDDPDRISGVIGPLGQMIKGRRVGE